MSEPQEPQSKILLAALSRPLASTTRGRDHSCTRCSRLADQIRRSVPNWQPPQAESWLDPKGVRHFAALCSKCADLEREERIQAAVGKGMSRDAAVAKYGRRERRAG